MKRVGMTRSMAGGHLVVVECILFGALDGKEVEWMLCLHAHIRTHIAASSR